MTKVLIAYSSASTHVPTTLEYLSALKKLPGCEVSFVHCTNDARFDFDINDFDVLVNSYCARLAYHDWHLSQDYVRAACSFRGLKIAIAQDEYDRTGTLQGGIRHLGFHVLFTSVPPQFWPLVYPSSEVPGVALKPLLTGYAPELHPDRNVKPLTDRSIQIGYRGREIGAKYGRLGFEKYEIGRYMAALCDEIGQSHDIRTDEASRIYGEDWFSFIGDCRTMLGSESGSNAFDFDGEIERRCVDIDGRLQDYHELADFLDQFERPFDCGQISPRVFECASMKTPMILFRGRYSDAIKPDVHYIPLEKDFSNARDIIGRLGNLDHLTEMAERASADLISSGRYSYRTLISSVHEAITEFLPRVLSDPANQHRRTIKQRWHFLHDRSDYESIALTERPTDTPQLPAYYFKKHEHLASLRYPKSPQNGASLHVEEEFIAPAATSIIRKAWHVLPKSVRYRLGPGIKNAIKIT